MTGLMGVPPLVDSNEATIWRPEDKSLTQIFFVHFCACCATSTVSYRSHKVTSYEDFVKILNPQQVLSCIYMIPFATMVGFRLLACLGEIHFPSLPFSLHRRKPTGLYSKGLFFFAQHLLS